MPRRPRYSMPREERAKQFLPFSALDGLDQLLHEQEILAEAEEKRILTNSYREDLIRSIMETPAGSYIHVVYYSDKQQYIDISGLFSGFNRESGFLIIDNDMIPLGDIYSFSV